MRIARNYTDGQRRITIKVEHTMSILDMAQYYTAWHRNDASDLAKIESKKTIIKTIHNELRSSGEEMSSYSVSDNGLDQVMDEVTEIFKVKFAKDFS